MDVVYCAIIKLILKRCQDSSYKTKDSFTIQCSTHSPWYLCKEGEKLCPYKIKHTDVYSSIQTMEYHSVLKRNDLSSKEKTWRKRR